MSTFASDFTSLKLFHICDKEATVLKHLKKKPPKNSNWCFQVFIPPSEGSVGLTVAYGVETGSNAAE